MTEKRFRLESARDLDLEREREKERNEKMICNYNLIVKM